MKISKRLILPRMVLICSAVLILAYLTSPQFDCNSRNAITPTVPIYPGSILIKKEDHSAPFGGSIWYEYAVNDTFAKVSAFYAANTGCAFLDMSASCTGLHKANPFGTYSVSIRNSLELSASYDISLVWDKCTPDWHKSVE